ncbi:MAG TPA: T9SS type A sorting domain-containing protein [Bacteroidota bacterium]|nr:T9SS type A sorting domain-containing protein [Bacteroidota bacterium]
MKRLVFASHANWVVSIRRLLLICALIVLYGNSQARAQWSPDPAVNAPISTAASNQYTPTLVSDGVGGAIITWSDNRNGLADIYAQRVNAAGIRQWIVGGDPNGVGVSTAADHQFFPIPVSDGAGGAIITWTDHRLGASSDIYAQRVDAAGVRKWIVSGDSNGVAITMAANDQDNARIVSDGAGGAIITWDDYRNGASFDIYAQRVNSAGTLQWKTNSVPISTAAGNQQFPTIVSDGAGGAIITWTDYRNYPGGTGVDVYAQRINSTGVRQWIVAGDSNGVAISRAAGQQGRPTLVSDGAGGAIITWTDYRSGASPHIFAQRIDSAGVRQWIVGGDSNGVAISRSANDQYDPRIVSDGAGGAIITWTDNRLGLSAGTYAQRIDSAGVVQWPTGGVPISTADLGQAPTIVSDGAGGAIIAWEDARSTSDPLDIYAQRINSAGIRQWIVGGDSNGVAISTAVDAQFHSSIASDGAGGAIITWEDNRSGTSGDIYAQRILSSGFLSPLTPLNLVVTPGNGQAQLRWSRNTEHNFLRYRIYRDTIAHPIVLCDSTIGGVADTSKVFTGLTNGTTYYFCVTAVDSVGPESDYSNEVVATPGILVFTVNNRWNMVSVALNATDYNKAVLFPSAISPAYAYEGAYVRKDTLANGPGYWLRFSGNQYVSIDGTLCTQDTIDVKEGWNMIGSISTAVAAVQISSVPGGLVTSPFFGYAGNYIATDSIRPGKAYWVKVDQDGKLILTSSTSAVNASDRIRIVHTPEMPPPAPDGKETESILPRTYALDQNYPNPFNPTTTLSYAIPEPSRVRLSVFNTLGQEVLTLIDQFEDAGYKKVSFDASKFSSGVYIYRIVAEATSSGKARNFIEAKKLVLLK